MALFKLFSAASLSLRSASTFPSTTALVVTELGRATLPAQLARRGLNIPVVGLLANGPLDEIIAKIGAWPRSRVEGEVKAWAGVNSPESAATELRRIVLASSDPQTRMACVDLTGQLGPLAESAVTSLLNTRARGHAVNWLNQHGLLADDDVDFEARTLAMLEMLSMHATGNPDDEPALAQMIKNLFTAVPSTELLNSLWRVPEAWAGDLLAAIGRLSSDRAVAKAARKGVMQHRTHIANMRNN